MTDIQKAYQTLQAACGIEVGDAVKVLRVPRQHELGSNCWTSRRKSQQVGNAYEVLEVAPRNFMLDTKDLANCYYPFFCLELIKKKEPKITITVTVNDVITKLSDISEETLLNIRRQNK